MLKFKLAAKVRFERNSLQYSGTVQQRKSANGWHGVINFLFHIRHTAH